MLAVIVEERRRDRKSWPWAWIVFSGLCWHRVGEANCPAVLVDQSCLVGKGFAPQLQQISRWVG